LSPEVTALLAVVGLVVAGALVDLVRSEVRHLPKWVWALIIVLVSFPIGVIVYVVVGRVPRAEPPAVTEEDGDAPADRSTAAPPGGAVGAPPAAASGVPSLAELPPGPGADDTSSAPALISSHALRKVYGATVALDDVDLVVPEGSTYGLIGPNGAGKTTMLAILTGLRRPTSGTFQLGVPRREIGVLPDTPHFEPWLTAYEIVDLARDLVAPELPRDRVEAALAEVGLEDAIGRRAGGFSRGMLQRLGLAACLVGDPRVLVLDEPSSALDPAGRREVLDLIGRLAHTKTVVLSTHILADVQQVCDQVGVIDHGQLRFQGPLRELLARTSSAIAVQVRPARDGDARSQTGGLAEAIRALPWAVSVDDRGPGRLHAVVRDLAAAERELPRLVAERELALVAMYPATDLETAFLELTS
jgi:ABC-2 type transport system ATP-binding protein